MKRPFKQIYIDQDIINYGEKCNIITFNEELFNESQLNALSKQYDKLGFLKCACKYKDDNVDVYYYTTNLINIGQYFSQNNFNVTEFVSIIKTICQSIKLCSNYIYFNQNNLIIDEELIYIDSKDKSIHIMYVPSSILVTEDVVFDLKKVIMYLINNYLKRGGEELFLQEILDELKNNRLNIDELIKLLDDIINKSNKLSINKSKVEVAIKPVAKPIKIQEFTPESFTSSPEIEQTYRNSKKEKKGFFRSLFSSKNSQKKTKPEPNYYNNRPSYTYMDDVSDDTIILGCNPMAVAYLISEDNYGEKVIINKDNFVIGRLKDVVDYEIKNKTVGKIHAKFIRQDNKYYLIDLESKNGTYMNGTKLIGNSIYEVEDGASIVFSNEKYKFIIEV